MKKILLFIIAIFISNISFAQIVSNSQSNSNRWVFSGGLGATFSDGFSLQVSPSAGYKITNNFIVGLSVDYFYNDYNSKTNVDYTSNLFGLGPFLQYYPIENIFLKMQYQYFTGKQNFEADYADKNIDENALWLGAGYTQSISGNAFVQIGLMYNVLYDEDDSVFNTGLMPIVGISFSF